MTDDDDTMVSESADSDDEVRPGRMTRIRALVGRVRGGRWRWAGAVVAAVALFAALAYFLYWPDQQMDEDAARSAVTAASEGTIAVYSYASTSVDRDIAAAKSHLTGEFLTQYERDASGAVASIAKQKAMKTNAAVTAAAVSQLRPDSADVLVFMNQTTTTLDSPGPSMASRSVMVTLSKVDGKWLISSIKPV